MDEKMTQADIRRFTPFTGRRSTLWIRGTESGSSEDSVPAGARVVGYAHPVRGGYRVEWC